MTEAQWDCVRELTEQVMVTRCDCREGEGEMWLALFEDGLTTARAREVVHALRRRPGFKRPRTMVYFRTALREAAKEPPPPVPLTPAEIRAADEREWAQREADSKISRGFDPEAAKWIAEHRDEFEAARRRFGLAA